MVILCCKNHPKQRWACKGIAWTTRADGTGYYNQCRNIFHFGVLGRGGPTDWTHLDPDTGEFVLECPCPATDLMLAPEQARNEIGQPVDDKGELMTH